MSLNFRRNYWIIIGLIITILISIGLSNKRIIAYNFGEGKEIQEKVNDFKNEIDLFDTSKIHDIKVDLSKNDYDMMVKTYQEIGEKDYYRTSITIDGVKIENIGIRLKGNLTLKQTLGGDMGMKNMNNNGKGIPNMEIDFDNMPVPSFMDLPENWENMTNEEKQLQFKELMPNRADGNMGGFGSQEEIGDSNPPFLIKLDEFVNGQSYQGLTELCIRIGSDKSLLSEPVVFEIHKQMGQIVPDTSYAVVKVAENNPSLYVIAENINEKYIEKYFPNEDGILYKAGNFVSLEYKGDDPSLYDEMFEQKTNIGDDDMAQFISFMKFISKSSDEEFEKELGNWIEIDSMVRMMVLDSLLKNNDSFIGMGSNYYLFYSKTKKIFTLLSWDQNLSLNGMGGFNINNKNGGMKEKTDSEIVRDNAMEKWINEGGDEKNQKNKVGPGKNGKNLLKERFLANERFKSLYDSTYSEIEEKIFKDGLGKSIVESFSKVFIEYNSKNNIMEQEKYLEQVNNKIDFFSTK